MRLVGLGVLGVGFREFWVSEPGLGVLVAGLGLRLQPYPVLNSQ